MEIGMQIKQRRIAAGLSQEALAEQIFVTRQTLSNWETGKTYPDINSLLRLTAVFHISLDDLVKGDIPKMKEQIKAEDIRRFNRESNAFAVMFLVMVLSVVPLTLWNKIIGTAIWLVICGVTMVSACRVERLKKQHNIQSYREIVAFTEGKRLDEMDAAVEKGKRPYQRILLIAGSALLGAAAAWLLHQLR